MPCKSASLLENDVPAVSVKSRRYMKGKSAKATLNIQSKSDKIQTNATTEVNENETAIQTLNTTIPNGANESLSENSQQDNIFDGDAPKKPYDAENEDDYIGSRPNRPLSNLTQIDTTTNTSISDHDNVTLLGNNSDLAITNDVNDDVPELMPVNVTQILDTNDETLGDDDVHISRPFKPPTSFTHIVNITNTMLNISEEHQIYDADTPNMIVDTTNDTTMTSISDETQAGQDSMTNNEMNKQLQYGLIVASTGLVIATVALLMVKGRRRRREQLLSLGERERRRIEAELARNMAKSQEGVVDPENDATYENNPFLEL